MKKGQTTAEPPVETTPYVASGLIGATSLVVVRRVYVPADFLASLGEDPLPQSEFGWLYSRKKGSALELYFPDAPSSLAERVARMIKADSMGAGWREIALIQPLAGVLNIADESRGKWSSTIVTTVAYEAFASSGRDKAMFHLVFLPSLVQSLALMAKMIDKPVWSCPELLTSEMLISPEDQQKLFNFGGPLEECEYFRRRQVLWEALGERNPIAYLDPAGGSKYACTSEQLWALVSLGMTQWASPLLARVVNGWNPNPAQAYGDTDANGQKGIKKVPIKENGQDTGRTQDRHWGHPTIPVVMEIFADEASAMAAAEIDKNRFTKRGAHAEAAQPGGLPAAYVGKDDDWNQAWAAIKSMLPPVPPALLLVRIKSGTLDKSICAPFMITRDELLAAVEHDQAQA
ncbi:MAG: hypothetical protein IPO08_22830 [Xanthomonadales bacterium]|nr:hypothetical protein [Xanthomonadales bacterium]